MKKLLAVLLALGMIFSLAACGGGGDTGGDSADEGNKDTSAEPIVMKLNHPSAAGGHYDMMAKEFKRLIEEKTEGRYVIEIYDSNALGTQEEALEAVSLGTLAMCVTSDDKIATYAPEWGYLGMPFLFKDVDDVEKNMIGDLGQYLSSLIEPKGLKIIAFFENGFRTLTAHKPVYVPTDLKGIKLRSLPAKPMVAFFEAAGAVITNVSFSELYSALNLNTCDAQENPFANIRDKKFYEVQEYLICDLHSHTCEPLVMSMQTWNSLSPEDQEIFAQCGLEATKWAYQYAREHNEENIEFLRGEMEVIEPDMGPWRELAEQTNAPYLEQYAEVAKHKK